MNRPLYRPAERGEPGLAKDARANIDSALDGTGPLPVHLTVTMTFVDRARLSAPFQMDRKSHAVSFRLIVKRRSWRWCGGEGYSI